MENNNFSIIEVSKKVNDFIKFNYAKEAYQYYKVLKLYIKNNNKNINPDSINKYKKLLVKLKFLSLNFFDDWNEINDLLKNHFEIIYDIDYYDIWEKLKINLAVIYDLDERDKIKKQLKNTLLNCDRNILQRKKYDKFINFPLSVQDWLKDYNVNLGIKEVDNLKRTQYLINGENIKKLNKEDKEKIKIIFDLYEKLKISSNSRKGLEEEVPVTINGKFFIFRNGEAEEVPNSIFEMIRSIKIGNEKETNLAELEQMLNKYPSGSLEYKVIQEEIEKLNR